MASNDHDLIFEQVNEEYQCDHKQAALVVKTQKNGARFYSQQCQRCGAEIERLKGRELSEEAKHGAIPYGTSIKEAWWKGRSARYSELREVADKKKKAEFDQWYQEYLTTEKWRKKRQKVIERANGICEGCLERKATQVHHLHYARVGHEMLFDLVAVCDQCHEDIHLERDESDETDVLADEDVPF